MLVADHGLQVIPEQQLAGGVVLRGDHIDGLVGVDGDKPGPAQLLGQVAPMIWVPSRQRMVSTMVVAT